MFFLVDSIKESIHCKFELPMKIFGAIIQHKVSFPLVLKQNSTALVAVPMGLSLFTVFT